MPMFDVVFRGEILPGKQVKEVKKRLSMLLKTDAGSIDRLFSGQPVAVRKNVDEATGRKFEKVFSTAGAVCYREPVGGATAPAVQGPPAGSPSPGPAAVAPGATTVMNADGGKMIITNIETVPGKTIVEHFGLVSGSTIRAKHVGRDIMASLKNLIGGELKGYTQLLKESRRQAMDRMVAQAKELGANAIVNVRFSTSSVAQGAAELYAYGTAVRVE
jgi:uncharacterized protein YbjQ (UPF0145 family)